MPTVKTMAVFSKPNASKPFVQVFQCGHWSYMDLSKKVNYADANIEVSSAASAGEGEGNGAGGSEAFPCSTNPFEVMDTRCPLPSNATLIYSSAVCARSACADTFYCEVDPTVVSTSETDSETEQNLATQHAILDILQRRLYNSFSKIVPMGLALLGLEPRVVHALCSVESSELPKCLALNAGCLSATLHFPKYADAATLLGRLDTLLASGEPGRVSFRPIVQSAMDALDANWSDILDARVFVRKAETLEGLLHERKLLPCVPDNEFADPPSEITNIWDIERRFAASEVFAPGVCCIPGFECDQCQALWHEMGELPSRFEVSPWEHQSMAGAAESDETLPTESFLHADLALDRFDLPRSMSPLSLKELQCWNVSAARKECADAGEDCFDNSTYGSVLGSPRSDATAGAIVPSDVISSRSRIESDFSDSPLTPLSYRSKRNSVSEVSATSEPHTPYSPFTLAPAPAPRRARKAAAPRFVLPTPDLGSPLTSISTSREAYTTACRVIEAPFTTSPKPYNSKLVPPSVKLANNKPYPPPFEHAGDLPLRRYNDTCHAYGFVDTTIGPPTTPSGIQYPFSFRASRQLPSPTPAHYHPVAASTPQHGTATNPSTPQTMPGAPPSSTTTNPTSSADADADADPDPFPLPTHRAKKQMLNDRSSLFTGPPANNEQAPSADMPVRVPRPSPHDLVVYAVCSVPCPPPADADLNLAPRKHAGRRKMASEDMVACPRENVAEMWEGSEGSISDVEPLPESDYGGAVEYVFAGGWYVPRWELDVAPIRGVGDEGEGAGWMLPPVRAGRGLREGWEAWWRVGPLEEGL